VSHGVVGVGLKVVGLSADASSSLLRLPTDPHLLIDDLPHGRSGHESSHEWQCHPRAKCCAEYLSNET
jgi:hypothetical protein